MSRLSPSGPIGPFYLKMFFWPFGQSIAKAIQSKACGGRLVEAFFLWQGQKRVLAKDKKRETVSVMSAS